jgi:alpha-tubulin suppressor-like RCC1 family protein
MYHSCGVTTAGEAYCWGLNLHGQLGSDVADRSLEPVAVEGGHRFRSISSGLFHSCGITTTGEAYCWGLNYLGQLGNRSTTSSAVPVAVSGGTRFSSISAGYGHTCALAENGEGYCWGGNDHGELGNMAIERPGFPGSLIPTKVGGGTRYRSITAGASHSCAIGTNRKAYCWGRGLFGQLGIGSTADWAMPQWVGDGYAMVSAGNGTHSRAARTDDRVFCWGTGELGQLGALTTTFTTVPVHIGRRR